MARTVQSTYASLLQGVSQQVPSLRLDGQVEEQVNMLSDPVTSIRRRPAVPYIASFDFGDISNDPLFVTHIERGVDGRHLIINTNTGHWFLLSEDLTSILKTGTDDYFIAKNGRTSIHTASLDLNMFILNMEQKPVTETDDANKLEPSTSGFICIKSGGFQISYTVTVTVNDKEYTATFTTPAASVNGSATQATPSYIATQLFNQLNTSLNGIALIYRRNNVIGIKQAQKLSIDNGTNSSYMITSGKGRVNAVGDLSFLMPESMRGYMLSVGTDNSALVWYRWDTESDSWQEDSAYGSITKISNMPRQLTALDEMEANTFEGRLSGDDQTNQDPAFIDNGIITGIGSYQGRLVLLSTSFVSLSKSNNPYRFYRSTVSDLNDDDRIDIGVGSQQNSIFRTAVQFNRDLIIFGDSIQAVVTSGNSILSPKNAAISLTSELSCDSRIQAVPDGQTLLYPYKRSAKFSGLMELIPSSYTSSQYISQDATAHIPQFISGRLRMLSSSSATNMVVMCSQELNKLIVHEYQWSSEGKTQAAWHEWVFAFDIVGMYFAQERLILYLCDKGTNTIFTTYIDPREGFDEQNAYPVPYLDLYSKVTADRGKFTLPDYLKNIAKSDVSRISLCRFNELCIIEEVGVDIWDMDKGTGLLTIGADDSEYFIGVNYVSSLVPTPPLIKDDNKKVVDAGAVRLVQMEISVKDSGQFNVVVNDDRTGVSFSMPLISVYLNSFDIVNDEPSVGSSSNLKVPCSTNADTTYVQLTTNGVHNMNVMDISYLLRHAAKHRRV